MFTKGQVVFTHENYIETVILTNGRVALIEAKKGGKVELYRIEYPGERHMIRRNKIQAMVECYKLAQQYKPVSRAAMIKEIEGQIRIEQGIARMRGAEQDWDNQCYHQGIEEGLKRALSILNGSFPME